MYLAWNYCDSDNSFPSVTLKIEKLTAHRNAYGERMTEAQEQQLERRLSSAQ